MSVQTKIKPQWYQELNNLLEYAYTQLKEAKQSAINWQNLYVAAERDFVKVSRKVQKLEEENKILKRTNQELSTSQAKFLSETSQKLVSTRSQEAPSQCENKAPSSQYEEEAPPTYREQDPNPQVLIQKKDNQIQILEGRLKELEEKRSLENSKTQDVSRSFFKQASTWATLAVGIALGAIVSYEAIFANC